MFEMEKFGNEAIAITTRGRSLLHPTPPIFHYILQTAASPGSSR